MRPTKHKKTMLFYAQKWGYSQGTICKYSKEGCNFDLSDDDVNNWILARSPRVIRNQNMETKTCSKCREIKHYSCFSKHKSQPDGHTHRCRDCAKLVYQEKNKDSIEAKNKKIAQNAERRKTVEYLEARRKRRRASDKRRLAARREYDRKRRETDPNYRLLCNLRVRTLKALKNNSKSDSTVGLLGCSIPYARKHLEAQFTDGMSWKNHGVHGWHIDHIIPCDNFCFSDPEQQRQCFHYTNLQPLWAFDNESKGNTLPDNHQPELPISIHTI